MVFQMKLDIPSDFNTIGLLFSGGMDSSLLLYMLGKHYPNRRIMAFSAGCSYIDNRVHNKYANQVFERVTNMLPEGALDYHITHYHDDKTTHHCNQAMKEFDGMVDVWVNGMNKAPPPGTVVTDCYGVAHDLYELCHLELRKQPPQLWRDIDGYKYYTPLAPYTKQEIVQAYKDYGIYDLIPFTRSCPKAWKFEDMKDFTPECGWCYFCLERKWGLMV